MNMIITSECEECMYGSIDETNKAKIIVHCSCKEKDYIFGQCIPCENFMKRDGIEWKKK